MLAPDSLHWVTRDKVPVPSISEYRTLMFTDLLGTSTLRMEPAASWCVDAARNAAFEDNSLAPRSRVRYEHRREASFFI
jgi:hypothetical protein